MSKTYKIIRAAVAAVLLITAAIIGIIINKPYQTDVLKPDCGRAVFFNVGHGDCILYYSKDACILTDVPDGMASKVTGRLERLGFDTIDYFIISHYDADHAGGAYEILKKFKVNTVIMPAPTNDGILIYKNIREAADDNSIRIAKTGQKYEINGIKIDILAPTYEQGDSANDTCVAAKITHNSRSLLLCGDISQKEEATLLNIYGEQLSSDVIKVSHHGSKYSSSSEFVKAVNAKYAVISCGDNYYGHPDMEVVKRFEENGAEVLITKTDGDIILDFLGDGVERVN